MPFCTQCARPIPADSRFCPACGAPVRGLSDLSQDPTRTSGPDTPTTPATSTSISGQYGRFEPGTRIGSRYRIVALLGRGGMGEVHRADDLDLGQSVALKFLPAGVGATPEELTRFRGEVRLARQIAHPNVCRVYDIGEADGHVFLSMEYIDGEDLASVLRRMGRPTSDKAIELARQLCLGLAAAHEAGMLHRDLKPANVMIDGRGRARITDFGLAGLAEELARGGQVAGTPAYMAPEQLADGRASVRSDVYSLGLVLYELFTGKRVFDAKNLAELRQQQDSGSITTPSDLARGIDPAVERVIMHCLERDPEARPSSAYAVLGALPGGDPLAAALAAGETPSPELVANSGDRGTLRPWVAATLVAAGLAALGVWAGGVGPEFRGLTTPPQVLSVRANDLLGRTGAFGALPAYTAEGFTLDRQYLKYLSKHSAERGRRAPMYFWRRWSPRRIEPTDIHQTIAGITDPPFTAAGQAAALFDPAGRLIGLRAVPPDTMRAAPNSAPPWSVLWSAAGLDSTKLVSSPPAVAVPATCDSAAAWTTTLPWSGGERVTVQAGASRGRLVHFTMLHTWGATAAPVDSLGNDPLDSIGWGTVLFGVLPLLAGIYFGMRNLRLGRGDWRSATRIAAFVAILNLFEGIFATRLSEVGLTRLVWDISSDRALGHAMLHGVQMWLAYVALEPYVRRLWPRMLVSWTRLVSGRWRDPLVGRDVLIGCSVGLFANALGLVAIALIIRSGGTPVPTQISDDMAASITSLAVTSCKLSYAASVCVLDILQTLVILLLFRMLLRRDWIAYVVASLLLVALFASGSASELGWVIALVTTLIGLTSILLLPRFGLLAAATSVFVQFVTSWTITTLDLSAWYADRALLPAALLLAILFFGAATALGGRSLFGDPLREDARTAR